MSFFPKNPEKAATWLMKNLFPLQVSSKVKQLASTADELSQEIRTRRTRTNGDLNTRIHEKLRAEWTYHSNAIEGSTLTLGDTIFLLRDGITIAGKPFKDFLDAKNHAQAIDYLFNIVSDPDRDISTFDIKKINQLLLTGVSHLPAITPDGQSTERPIQAGQYKQFPNSVMTKDSGLHAYVDPLHVDSQMDELFEWINEQMRGELHPLLISSTAHYNFTRIHPFDDGNGRGARLLTNLILLKRQFPTVVIRTENRSEYIDALYHADVTDDLNPFTEFLGESLVNTQRVILDTINDYEQVTSNSTTPGPK